MRIRAGAISARSRRETGGQAPAGLQNSLTEGQTPAVIAARLRSGWDGRRRADRLDRLDRLLRWLLRRLLFRRYLLGRRLLCGFLRRCLLRGLLYGLLRRCLLDRKSVV